MLYRKFMQDSNTKQGFVFIPWTRLWQSELGSTMFLLLVGCSGYLSPGDKKFWSSGISQSLGPLNQSSLCAVLMQHILLLRVSVLDLNICMSIYYLKVTQFKSRYFGSQFFQKNPIKMTVIIFLLTDFRNTLFYNVSSVTPRAS
jgi:hypothetical protein